MLSADERFEYCFKIILEHEGGLSTDKRDPGGTTKWGISLRYLKMIGLDLNDDGVVDEKDIFVLDKENAKQIYYENWWLNYQYSRFKHIEVAAKVFDLAVNMGGYAAHKLCQIAINRLRDKPIAVDGILGDESYGAANKLDAHKLREELRKCAEHKYRQILADNPHMEWARNGWMRRARW